MANKVLFSKEERKLLISQLKIYKEDIYNKSRKTPYVSAKKEEWNKICEVFKENKSDKNLFHIKKYFDNHKSDLTPEVESPELIDGTGKSNENITERADSIHDELEIKEELEIPNIQLFKNPVDLTQSKISDDEIKIEKTEKYVMEEKSDSIHDPLTIEEELGIDYANKNAISTFEKFVDLTLLKFQDKKFDNKVVAGTNNDAKLLNDDKIKNKETEKNFTVEESDTISVPLTIEKGMAD
ncbi:hypothetical protein TKK_0013787 [Trichogramma kaykai]